MAANKPNRRDNCGPIARQTLRGSPKKWERSAFAWRRRPKLLPLWLVRYRPVIIDVVTDIGALAGPGPLAMAEALDSAERTFEIRNNKPSHRATPKSQGGEEIAAGASVARLAVSDARLALADFYNVAIRIANVAGRLAVLFLWLCDKLGPSVSP